VRSWNRCWSHVIGLTHLNCRGIVDGGGGGDEAESRRHEENAKRTLTSHGRQAHTMGRAQGRRSPEGSSGLAVSCVPVYQYTRCSSRK
jgi:hypothetical protein